MLQDLATAEIRSEQPFTDRPMTLRFSLRRDTQTHAPLPLEPYVLDVFWAKTPDDQIGDVSLSFFRTLDNLHVPDVEISDYQVGGKLKLSEHMHPEQLVILEKNLFQLFMSNGQRFTIVASGALPSKAWASQSGIYFDFVRRPYPHSISTPIYLTVISDVKEYSRR